MNDEYDRIAATPQGEAVLGNWQRIEQPQRVPLPDMAVFPPVLRDMIEEVSKSTNTPKEMAIVNGLGASSACIAGRVSVQIKEDWREWAQLFLLLAAPPSSGKSPVFNMMLYPLTDMQAEENERRKAEIAHLKHQRAVLDAKAKRAKPDELEAILRQQQELPELYPVGRYITGNCTPERLTRLMHENGNAVAQLDDEGDVLDILCGRYSDAPDLSPWLQGYSGNPVQMERQNGSVSIPHAHVSLTISTQPLVLQSMVTNPRMRGKGLLARFLTVSCEGNPKFVPDPPSVPQPVKKAYMDALARMYHQGNVTLRLTQEAYELFQNWQEEMHEGERWQPLREHEFKLKAMPIRLAANLAAWAGNVFEIDASGMQQAITLARWFLAHLDALFGDHVQLSTEALEVRNYLIKNRKSAISERDAINALRNRPVFKGKKPIAIREAVEELLALDYLRGCKDRYEVNPYLRGAKP